jgi:hypothetical protein
VYIDIDFGCPRHNNKSHPTGDQHRKQDNSSLTPSALRTPSPPIHPAHHVQLPNPVNTLFKDESEKRIIRIREEVSNQLVPPSSLSADLLASTEQQAM